MSIVSDVIEHCTDWARAAHGEIRTGGAWIFGSTIYKGGAQFDPEKSDIDLVIEIPDDLTSAPQRTGWLSELRKLKHKLELGLIPILGRSNVSKPIVSVLAVTAVEVAANVHKSGAPGFFSNSAFLDLLATSPPAPLRATTSELGELEKQVVQLTQKVRSEYLGIAATGRGSLTPHDDAVDPIPKAIMRHAAMARRTGNGSTAADMFDAAEGLDHITNYIYQHRSAHERYDKLSEIISVRRNARGTRSPIADLDHLLLAEVLYDMVDPPSVRRAPLPAPSGGSTSAPPPGALAEPLEAVFLLTKRHGLQGTDEELLAEVERAGVNIKWQREPCLTLRAPEIEEIDSRLAALSGDVSPAARREHAGLTDRRNRLVYTLPTVQRGLRLLLEYQYLLLPVRKFGRTRAKWLLAAMKAYVAREFDTSGGGGFLQAYVYWMDFQLVVSFSLPRETLNRYLTARYGNTNTLELTDNPDVLSLPNPLVARFLIPEVVAASIPSRRLEQRALEIGAPMRALLALDYWRFGPA